MVLPAYPELRRQVDLSALRLRSFLRGTLAVTAGGPAFLAGPKRIYARTKREELVLTG